MKSHHKQILRDLGRRSGLEIRLSSINSRDDLRLAHFLTMRGIDTILDVGANNGGFAQMMIAAGFAGRIISFEPLPGAHEALIAAARGYANWIIAPPMALSDEAGIANFNVTEGDASSSLLLPSDGFVADTPFVKVAKVIQVSTMRLDDFGSIPFDPARTLLKLDVQGAEGKVFAGANKAMNTIAGVLTEMSLMPLYDGQPGWTEINDIIVKHGLDIWDIWLGYRSPMTARLTQVDGLYFRV